MNNKKVDYRQFYNYIDDLTNSPWLGPSRRWWPKFVFHFTNITNAIQILETGYLYPRSKVSPHGLMVNDNASREVIENTDPTWFDYVRLYFRPRTPTQWHNEGFIPVQQRFQQAHCPVPIFFLFDSKNILSRNGVLFSGTSLARRDCQVYSDAESFRKLPFKYIYHDSSFTDIEKWLIIGARQAEVIVPDKLDLTDLKYIWCRSEAEYNTLLYLLSPGARNKWKNKIGAGKKGNLFYRRWVFVEKVDMNTQKVTFYFNAPQETCLPFPVRVVIVELSTKSIYSWEDSSYQLPENYKLEISLRNLKFPNEYEITLYFDDQLMYAGRFSDEVSILF
ncbi:MAG TPA: DarT ssDNA thymidine ADP-ribosyltransferase family protein [Syntrophomonadaceae bacterium]|nr:DarT ssDNA thymidine ADP-ribosyltransferase family protein [Syntrophomonadaceae bacterium]HPU49305.1 DarT ssDNA thymidine ADP-ribosyltransferase family protein [Syntrophomonadaceae bacterium]HQD90775.1 DarT ssDNA thymidine ADP-ribosyltransferase family protein [Syntrophomonadaceae bacterium]